MDRQVDSVLCQTVNNKLLKINVLGFFMYCLAKMANEEEK